jgi:competence protein ComEC
MIPRLRILALIPFFAVYFSLYAQLTLTGSLPIATLQQDTSFLNSSSLQAVVDGKDHNIVVQVESLISSQNSGYFTAKLLELDDHHLNYSPLLEMRWYKPTIQVQLGEKHAFTVRFKPVYGRANPDGFDRQKWKYSQHIAYRAKIKAHLQPLISSFSIRAYLYQKMTTVTKSLNNNGILLALSFADKSLIKQPQKELIQKLGIAHLFAISGLHISLFFSFVYVLLHFLVNNLLPLRLLGWFSWRLLNISALMGAFLYTYLAGFSLPTQRAFLMLFFAVVVLSMKRKCSLLDLLSGTLFVILLWDPLSVLSLSLWFSFAAVSLILITLWYFPNIKKTVQQNDAISVFNKIKHYLKLLILIQFSLTLLMLPIQLFAFSSFTVLSALINFVAVPLFSLVIIPMTLFGVLFSLLYEPLAFVLLSAADKLIFYFFNLFAKTSNAYLFLSDYQGEILSFIIVTLIVIFIAHKQGLQNMKISALFIITLCCFIPWSVWNNNQKHTSNWWVEVFDVGQGLAVLVRSKGNTLLYDTGPRYPSGFTTANAEIVPYFFANGINKLDYLVISHSDIDHAGGTDMILEHFSPSIVLLGEPIESEKLLNYQTLQCLSGMQWQLGSLHIKALSPTKLTKNNNNNSCVLKISDGKTHLLLTGDIDKKQEAKLVDKYAGQLQSHLLIAPHHGSKYSSSKGFIKAVAPQWSIFTAGFMNQWGFPRNEVKLRYKEQGAQTLTTGINGFIRFNIQKDKIIQQTYREDLAGYWYHHTFSL